MKFKKLNENGPIELDFLTDDDGNERLGLLFKGKHYMDECIRVRNNPWIGEAFAAECPDYIQGFWAENLNTYFIGYVDEDNSEYGAVDIYEAYFEEDEEND